MRLRPPRSPLFPYTTLFRSVLSPDAQRAGRARNRGRELAAIDRGRRPHPRDGRRRDTRSEEHTSELQSHSELVCRLLLEKKKQLEAKARPVRHAALVRAPES